MILYTSRVLQLRETSPSRNYCVGSQKINGIIKSNESNDNSNGRYLFTYTFVCIVKGRTARAYIAL